MICTAGDESKKNEIGGECSTYGEIGRVDAGFCGES